MKGLRAALAALCAALALPGAVASETIAEVLNGGPAQEGRSVELEGYVDQCTRRDCHLCPTAGLPDPRYCIMLLNWAYEGDIRDLRVADRVSDALDELYRFAKVSIRATVNYYSDDDWVLDMGLIGYHGASPVLCPSGRGCQNVGLVTVRDVTITAVHGRGQPTDGPVTGRDAEKLQPPTSEQDRAIRKAFYGRAGRFDELGKAHTFMIPSGSSGWLCLNRDQGPLPERWPELVGHLQRSPASRYVCWRATRDGDSFRFIRSAEPLAED